MSLTVAVASVKVAVFKSSTKCEAAREVGTIHVCCCTGLGSRPSYLEGTHKFVAQWERWVLLLSATYLESDVSLSKEI